MILNAAGSEEIANDLKILNTNILRLKDGMATTWNKGRVFLAGNAAQRIPPSAGFVLDKGIQDVNNCIGN